MKKIILLGIACFSMAAAWCQFSYQSLEVLYDSAWTYKNLELIPIRFKAGQDGERDGAIISLSQAILKKKAVIRELPSKVGADRGTVTITNKSKQSILVQSGELIHGGKQDRVIAKTVIIPPGTKREHITTFCVEKGRWDEKAHPFGYSGTGDVSLRKTIDTRRNQAAVWKEIDLQFGVAGQSSRTWSYLHLMDDSARRNEYAQYFKNKFNEKGAGLAGFLFITGNQILSVELFSRSEYTAASFDAMLATYINSLSDAPDPPMVSRGRKETFLDNILTSREQQFKLIKTQGAAHRNEGELVHIVVYGTHF